MNRADLTTFLENFHCDQLDLVRGKGGEYAGDEDALGNFKVIGGMSGKTPLDVWFVYMAKHFLSIASYVESPRPDSELSEPIYGRLLDLANYCALGAALIEEDKDG